MKNLPVPARAKEGETVMIKLRDISKFYSNGFVKTFVLRNIDLDVQEGEFLTVMGPSGAGKSTLLYIIGMLDDPSEGQYYFYDQAIHSLNEKKRTGIHQQNIGFVFQSYHLIDELTVYENLETPLLYKKVKSNERKSLVADTLDRFRIVAKKDLFPSQLSGGQQQLVAVARAVIINPKLILADEPTGNLNSKQGEEIMELFKKLNREGTTIIQATHSEKNASYSDRVIYLLDGWMESEEKTGMGGGKTEAGIRKIKSTEKA
jgi:ABC-type lipoprotein export system ATPase subunit